MVLYGVFELFYVNFFFFFLKKKTLVGDYFVMILEVLRRP